MDEKITVFDTCSNVDWQIFSIVNSDPEKPLPDAVLSPPLNLNRWLQSKQTNDNFNDTFLGNIQKLWGNCCKRNIKLFLRLRVVAKNQEIIDSFLQENDAFAKYVVIDLQGKCNQLYWNDFNRHVDFLKDMAGTFKDRLVGGLVNKRDNDDEQLEYENVLKSLGMINLETQTNLVQHLFDTVDLEMIKKFTKFTGSLGQQSESYKDTRKFILRLYKSCSEADPFSKYRLENTLNCDDFEDLYKAFTLQQIYRRNDENSAKKIKLSSDKIDIFKKRPDMEKIHPTICVDLSWTIKMSEKEISKLVSQLARLHGANKHTQKRTRILFTGCVEDSFLHKELLRKFQENLTKWGNCYFIKKSYSNIVPQSDYNIIYLSPDSDIPLDDNDFSSNSCFIIGGLVDETVQTKLSLTKATSEGLQTRRFPIEENMKVPVGSNTRPALAINQVGEILFKKINQENHKNKGKLDWKEIFEEVLPARYGLS